MITRNYSHGTLASNLLYLCLLLVSLHSTTQLATIPIRSSPELKYHVVYISGVPPEGSKTIPMISPTNGEKFDCVLPETDATDSDSTTKAQKTQIKRKSPSELLKDMTACLYRLTGWWTYEFCRGAHVRQFHQEDKVVMSQFYLGKKFSGTANDENNNDEDEDVDDDDDDEHVDIGLDTMDENEKEVDPATGYPTNYIKLVIESKTGEKEGEKEGDSESENGKQDHEIPQEAQTKNKKKSKKEETSLTKFYTEIYTEGTVCDLTNQPRTIEVQYFCTEGDKSYISEINEPSTCNYQMFVATPLLCRHPDYNSQYERVYPIECYSKPTEEL